MRDTDRMRRSTRWISVILISYMTGDADQQRSIVATAIRRRGGKSWRIDLASECDSSECPTHKHTRSFLQL